MVQVAQYQHQKYVAFVKCVVDVARRNEHSFGYRGTQTG